MPEYLPPDAAPDICGHQIKQFLRDKLTFHFQEQQLRTWFDPLHMTYSRDNKSLVLHFPHQFFAEWFTAFIKQPFEQIFYSLVDDGVKIRYGNSQDKKVHHPAFSCLMPEKDCTFDQFLVNKKNFFPLVSAQEICSQQAVRYNPFVVSGAPGTGKSHLLKAIANGLPEANPTLSYFYSSVDDLHSIYQSFYRNPLEARNQLSTFDVLLLDDLQDITKFDHLQQELIALLNTFHDHRRQMVFGLTGKIAALKNLDPKLKSRLEWGLIVTLKQPDLEIRLKYVQQQNRRHNLGLNKYRALTLAQHFQDFRALKGIVVKLLAYKELVRSDLTDKNYEQIIDSLEEKPRPPLTAERIKITVAKKFQLEPTDLDSSRRHHEVVLARQLAMYLCRQLLGMSFPRIGSLFGGKDHSTALYAVKKIKELQSTNKDIKNMLMELEERCRSAEN